MSVQVSLQMVPQDLVCYPMIVGFENVVGVSNLLGIQFLVISTILKHRPFLPECMTQLRWLRLRSQAVAKLDAE